MLNIEERGNGLAALLIGRCVCAGSLAFFSLVLAYLTAASAALDGKEDETHTITDAKTRNGTSLTTIDPTKAEESKDTPILGNQALNKERIGNHLSHNWADDAIQLCVRRVGAGFPSVITAELAPGR